MQLLQTWGIQNMKHQTSNLNSIKTENTTSQKDAYLQLACRKLLTTRDAAQDTRLAQEPKGSNKAENRQTGSRPQNSGEVFGSTDGRGVLCIC
jgi:hypothetical protein